MHIEYRRLYSERYNVTCNSGSHCRWTTSVGDGDGVNHVRLTGNYRSRSSLSDCNIATLDDWTNVGA